MASAFHLFSALPAELQIAIYRVALENETRTRRVVLWDGRVMPLPNLASPLLQVNNMARQCAQEFYPTKVAIYTIPEPLTTALRPAERDRAQVKTSWRTRILRTPGARLADGNPDLISYREPAEVSPLGRRLVIDLKQACTDFISDIQSARARKMLQRLEQGGAMSQGVMYLNPDRDTILYGYNCGPDFYDHTNSIKTRNDLVWRHFSDRLPPSFYPIDDGSDVLGHFRRTERSLIVVSPRAVTGATLRPNVGSRLFAGDYCDRDAISREYGLVAPKPVCRILKLTQEESLELMSRLTVAPRRLPGRIGVWSAYHVEARQPGSAVDDALQYQPLENSMEALEKALEELDKAHTVHENWLLSHGQDDMAGYQYGRVQEAMILICDRQKQMRRALSNCKCFATWKAI